MATGTWTPEDVMRVNARHSRNAAPVVVNAKRQKFGNQRTADPVTGEIRDSKLEARHSWELEARQRAGEIRNLQRQKNWALVINGIHICDYRADFEFEERGNGDVWNRRVADSKSEPTRKTQNYKIKKKLMEAIHGITILEMR